MKSLNDRFINALSKLFRSLSDKDFYIRQHRSFELQTPPFHQNGLLSVTPMKKVVAKSEYCADEMNIC